MMPQETTVRSAAMQALLGLHFAGWSCAAACIARAGVTDATAAQERVDQLVQQERQNNGLCGWIGTGVSPMTAAFAESLGMAEPYGAIFDQPEPGSPAAQAHIEQGDVLTSINGAPLMRAGDFAGIISAMAPGTTVYLATWRDGQPRQVTLTLGAAPCRASG
jgi:serine protease Do